MPFTLISSAATEMKRWGIEEPVALRDDALRASPTKEEPRCR